jgi:hypothetical protein
MIASQLFNSNFNNNNLKHSKESSKYYNLKANKCAYIKAKLDEIRKQTQTNNQLNERTKLLLLDNLKTSNIISKSEQKNSLFNSQKCQNYKMKYSKHNSYWQQMWSFSDNPLFEYGKYNKTKKV